MRYFGAFLKEFRKKGYFIKRGKSIEKMGRNLPRFELKN